jgi:hypothetical protein
MNRQRSVQQQNAAAKAEIERVAAKGVSLPWLYAVLRSHQLEPRSGLLVRLSETPEQEGNLFSGVWLSERSEFWEFAVVISRASEELVGVERFTNATASYPVAPRVQGTGSSFGHLACQVLREARGA